MLGAGGLGLEVSSYDLFIDLDFEGLRFDGKLGIALKTERDVVLDSVGLDIHRVYSDHSQLGFKPTDDGLSIQTGPFEGVLHVEYSGRVPDSLAGIYRAPYGKTHVITTHFEAAQARRMFPCIDRPDVKASFKLSVRIDAGLNVISNMPIQSEQSDGGKKIVIFQPTPRMSTYLLYLGVGKFQERSERLGNTEVVVAATADKPKLGEFAEAEAKNALEFFNSYYGIPYALPKLHLIAVPEFPMGAMENWGAITFREVLLLVDAKSSVRSQIRAAMAIAHEIAHQWFGDLVTMRWWDDIWLNESFATYMSYKAVDHAHPEWRIWENFFNGEPRAETSVGAMTRDSLRNTHPIQVPVSSPDEIEQIFDAISYGKGAHVLQMIDAYVGAEAFRQGVRQYLASHAYSNAIGDELWSAVEEASGKPVKRIMSAWLRQPGFPIISAKAERGKLELGQRRMLVSDDAKDGELWPVPIVADVDGKRMHLLLDQEESGFDVGEVETLTLNPGRKGYYAVDHRALGDVAWRSLGSA